LGFFPAKIVGEVVRDSFLQSQYLKLSSPLTEWVFYVTFKIKYMMLIVGLLCLAVAGLMYSVMKLYEKISNMEDILKSMNDDLNMIAHAKKNEKQLLKG
jgi:hypothetical protein